MKPEVNGAANIVMFIDHIEESKAMDYDNSVEDMLAKIRAEAMALVAYITLLDNPGNVKWSDISMSIKSLARGQVK